MRANKQMDEQVAQYFSLYSWLFWPTVHGEDDQTKFSFLYQHYQHYKRTENKNYLVRVRLRRVTEISSSNEKVRIILSLNISNIPMPAVKKDG